jgi:glycosyltransferase involved in cell wall biosynthesis
VRIAYLSKSEIPSASANSIQVMKTCESMTKAGHDVLLICIGKGHMASRVWEQYGVKEKFQVVRYSREHGPRSLFWDLMESLLNGESGWRAVKAWLSSSRSETSKRKYCWKYAWLALKACHGWRPDLVYGRDPWSLELATLLKKPLVFELHKAPTRRIERLLNKMTGRSKFRRLVVISEALKDHCRQRFPGLKDEDIVVAPDAAEIIERQAPVGHPDILRVGYTGKLEPGKGSSFLVALAKACPEFEFHISGRGTDEDDFERVSLQAPNIVYHGQVAHVEARRLQASMDILIAPYAPGKDELFQWMSPLKLFEYMAAGRPILCSDLPVLREILEHDETALLLPPESPTDWRQALILLRDDFELAQRLGKNARRRMIQEFTWARRLEIVLLGLGTGPSAKQASGPDFLCIGSQKAGTTWLYKNLRKHPEIWLPPVKALRFFNEPGSYPLALKALGRSLEARRWRHLLVKTLQRLRDGKLDRQLAWYLNYLFRLRTPRYYLSLFSDASGSLSGEVTPAYCRLPEAKVVRVSQLLPKIKILYLARNPIDRMYSHAAMRFGKLGRDLDQVPLEELADWLDSGPPRAYSDIAGTLACWERHFGTDSVFVLFYDHLQEKPQEAFGLVQEFLGVSQCGVPEVWKVHNEGSYPAMSAEVKGVISDRCSDLIYTAHVRFKNRFTSSWVHQLESGHSLG